MYKFLITALSIRRALKKKEHFSVGGECLLCESNNFTHECSASAKFINKDLRNKRISVYLKSQLIDKPKDSLFIAWCIRTKKKMNMNLWDYFKYKIIKIITK